MKRLFSNRHYIALLKREYVNKSLETSVKPILLIGAIVAILVSQSGATASDIGLEGIGGRIGLVFPITSVYGSGADGTYTIGVVADMGTLANNLPWEIALTYWRAGDPYYSLGNVYRTIHTDVAIRNSVSYLFKLQEDMYLYPGAGVGLNFFDANSNGPSSNSRPDYSEIKPSVFFLSGMQFKIDKKWHCQAELQVDVSVPADVDGVLAQTSLQLDFIYELGK